MKKRGSKLIPKKISANRSLLTSLFVDIFDALVNIFVAIITGSIVMLAEAMRSITDTIAVVLTYVGLKRSKKKPSKEHPFGYGKSLYVWTFISGIIMFGFVSVGIFYFGLKRFLEPEEIENIAIALVVLTIFVFLNSYSFSVGLRRILDGKKIRNFFKIYKNSPKVETKVTLILDFVGAVTPLIGLIALGIYFLTGNLKFDGIGAMAIGIILGVLTLFLLINTKQLLIGKRASPKIERKIKKAILSVKNVKSVLDLKTMIVGLGKILVNAEVHVNQNLNTKQIEQLMDQIKETAKKEVKEISHIQIELETPESNVKISVQK